MLSVTAHTLKSWLRDRRELAVLDVREAGRFGEAHLFHAIALPYSRFELDLPRLVPRLHVPLVLVDDGVSGVAERAAQRALDLGYKAVHVLENGTAGWQAAGYTLYAGVNVPSKTFGELVEHACHTPRISAEELHAMRVRKENVVVVDGRPWSEYTKFNIPDGVCCPNGELALRIGEIAPDPNTRVVVNCAGRTRSIIGAQTLINFGVPNPVVALENGTQGWFLAGFTIERGAQRRYPAAPDGAALQNLRTRAEAAAQRLHVPFVEVATAQTWLNDDSRTCYLFDVRTAEEFATGHVSGAVHAPGGQLVQATDQWVGVRGARLILVDSEGVRAPMMAAWLRQLGHDAHVLRGGLAAARAANLRAASVRLPRFSALELVTTQDLVNTCVLDLRSSAAYRLGHHPQARWSIRSRVVADAQGAHRVALVADELGVAQLAAIDLIQAGVREVLHLAQPDNQVATPMQPPDAEREDFLFFTARRHEGDRADAEKYLSWETGLLAQLDDEERSTFQLA